MFKIKVTKADITIPKVGVKFDYYSLNGSVFHYIIEKVDPDKNKIHVSNTGYMEYSSWYNNLRNGVIKITRDV